MTQTSPAFRIEIRRNCGDSQWGYPELDQRQRQIATEIQEGAPGALLLSEVAPVITLGRRTPQTDLLFDIKKFKEQGITVYETDRGGLGTYHGPGQWVVFPVDRLEVLTGDPRGVRKIVHALLDLGLAVARTYDSDAEIRDGAQIGVWNKKGKLASVGIHVQDGILFHGLCINGYRTQESFWGLRPCGLDVQPSFLIDDALQGIPRESAFLDLQERILDQALQRFWI